MILELRMGETRPSRTVRPSAEATRIFLNQRVRGPEASAMAVCRSLRYTMPCSSLNQALKSRMLTCSSKCRPRRNSISPSFSDPSGNLDTSDQVLAVYV